MSSDILGSGVLLIFTETICHLALIPGLIASQPALRLTRCPMNFSVRHAPCAAKNHGRLVHFDAYITRTWINYFESLCNENTVTSSHDYLRRLSYLPRRFWRMRHLRLGRFSPHICKYRNRKEICFRYRALGPRKCRVKFVMLRLEDTDIRALRFRNRHTIQNYCTQQKVMRVLP